MQRPSPDYWRERTCTGVCRNARQIADATSFAIEKANFERDNCSRRGAR
jgi:hypothetical protein